MPLFDIKDPSLSLIRPRQFEREKEIQQLLESSLEAVFSCRFVASEFSTGSLHGGRIDTLALTEDGNPAIIEYKKVESSELINQSLFYLSWLNDHRGDFQVASQSALGADTEIDWSSIRVICIAPSYRKYDLHAVQMMGANIELWRYRLFENNTILFDEVFRATSGNKSSSSGVAAQAGALATPTRPEYSVAEHLAYGNDDTRVLAEHLRDYCLSLSDTVEESPKKLYIAFKVAKNFCCMEVQKKRVLLHLRLDPDGLAPLPAGTKDMRNIGHYGTGDLQVSVTDESMLGLAEQLIEQAFVAVGGS